MMQNGMLKKDQRERTKRFTVHANYLIRWMGEKYDGVRFCWNAIQKRAYHLNIVRDTFLILN